MRQQHKLIDARSGDHPCAIHPVQKLIDLYNDPNWTFDAVATDKLLFTCTVCNSERVYQLLPQKFKQNEQTNS